MAGQKARGKKETKLRHEGIRDTSARAEARYKFANFVNAEIYTKLRTAMALRAHGVSRDFWGRSYQETRITRGCSSTLDARVKPRFAIRRWLGFH
jgi:hypothetical protein